MDCIPHFKTMQDCFREHPEIYGGELEEDEEGGEEGEVEGGERVGMGSMSAPTTMTTTDDDGVAAHLQQHSATTLPPSATSATPTPEHSVQVQIPSSQGNTATERAKKATEQVRREHGEGLSESEEVVPKAALDATGKNDDQGT